MNEQHERADALKKLVEQTTEFMRELTALALACKLYVEKQTAKK